MRRPGFASGATAMPSQSPGCGWPGAAPVWPPAWSSAWLVNITPAAVLSCPRTRRPAPAPNLTMTPSATLRLAVASAWAWPGHGAARQAAASAAPASRLAARTLTPAGRQALKRGADSRGPKRRSALSALGRIATKQGADSAPSFRSAPERRARAANSVRNKVFMMAASRLNHDGRAGHRRKSRRAGRDAGHACGQRLDGHAA